MADRFWIGGQGNTDDTAHWSTTSGGVGGASLPTSADNVYFDANSFTDAGQTVTVNATFYCLDMDWTGATNTPTLAGSGMLVMYGDVIFIGTITDSHTSSKFLNGANKQLTTNGMQINYQLVFSDGMYSLQDDLVVKGLGWVRLGSITTNSHNITCVRAYRQSSSAHNLILGSSIITCSENWDLALSANLTLNAGTSTIILTGDSKTFAGGNLTYNNLELQGDNCTITGSNTFNELKVKAGNTAVMTAGTTQTAGKICSDTAGSPATLSCASGTVTLISNDVQDIATGGGATFVLGQTIAGSATCSVTTVGDVKQGQVIAGNALCAVTTTGGVKQGQVMAGSAICSATTQAKIKQGQTISGSAICSATIQCNAMQGLRGDLTDADTYSFPMSDKTYIYNGTDFMYYDGTKIGKVADIAYVPTISNKRTPAGVGVAHEKLNFLSTSWKDSFNGTVGDTAYTLSCDADSVVVHNNGVLVDPGDYTFPTGADYGTVTFGAGQGEGVDNVVITGTKAGLTDPTVITKCTQFIVYGGKNDNRVFACRLNVRYHSGLEDATYWPVDAFEIITSDAEDITGFGKMIDYLINLKKRSLTFTNIDADSSGNTIWPIYPLNDEYGCIAKDSIKSVNNGLIFLAGTNEGSPAGVAYLSTSTVRDQLNVQIISRDINTSVDTSLTGLLGYAVSELTNAKAYIFDDKYWLKVGDKCWILDLKQSDFSQGKYCWYPYDGIPADANCFLDYSGDLYLGHDTNGLIYKESTSDDEDGSALDFYWTSPIIFCGTRTWMKDFEELFVTFGRQVIGNNKLTFITDDGKEEVLVAVQSANLFDFASIDFSAWSFGANPFPSTQPEIVGYSAEYLQWKIQNDELDQGLVILAQELTYRIGERV